MATGRPGVAHPRVNIHPPMACVTCMSTHAGNTSDPHSISGVIVLDFSLIQSGHVVRQQADEVSVALSAVPQSPLQGLFLLHHIQAQAGDTVTL